MLLLWSIIIVIGWQLSSWSLASDDFDVVHYHCHCFETFYSLLPFCILLKIHVASRPSTAKELISRSFACKIFSLDRMCQLTWFFFFGFSLVLLLCFYVSSLRVFLPFRILCLVTLHFCAISTVFPGFSLVMSCHFAFLCHFYGFSWLFACNVLSLCFLHHLYCCLLIFSPYDIVAGEMIVSIPDHCPFICLDLGT